MQPIIIMSKSVVMMACGDRGRNIKINLCFYSIKIQYAHKLLLKYLKALQHDFFRSTYLKIQLAEIMIFKHNVNDVVYSSTPAFEQLDICSTIKLFLSFESTLLSILHINYREDHPHASFRTEKFLKKV